MSHYNRKLAILASVFTLLLICAAYLPVLPQSPISGFPYALAADNQETQVSEYITKVTDSNGNVIYRAIFPAKPPDVTKARMAVAAEPVAQGAASILSSVPAFTWSYGCSPTAAAMLAGYYDQPARGYTNIYTGPANGGVCPLNNETYWSHTTWADFCNKAGYALTCGECPLSSTHNGVDGRSSRGNVDDFWTGYLCPWDPYNGYWTQHNYDCLADYMGTSQWYTWQNFDGSTTFFFNYTPVYDYSGSEPTYRDGAHGIKLFFQSMGYTVSSVYNQLIYGYNNVSSGFTYDQYKSEINAGRPVLIQLAGHTMLGYGYADPNIVYIHNTWDNSDHTMTWGGTYSNMAHIGVTVIQLAPQAAVLPAVNNGTGASSITATSAILNGNLVSDGGGSTAVTVYWGGNDGGTTAGNWANAVSLGVRSAGAFSTGISGLTLGNTYYYRCAATNSAGTAWASSTASFVSMPSAPLLLGTSVADCGIKAGANAFYLSRFQAVQSGLVVTFRLNANGPGSVKVAIYSDNGGMPYVKLAGIDTEIPVTAGQNDINFTLPVTAGTYYWIAFNSSANIVCMSALSCKTYILNSNPFSGFTFPSACTPYLPPSSKSMMPDIACLGPLPIPPQSAPTPISPASSVGFKWSTVNGATNYWLQVNTSDNFTGANLVNSDLGNVTSRDVSGIADGTTYYWRVKAGNSFGWGIWSGNRAVVVGTSGSAGLEVKTAASPGNTPVNQGDPVQPLLLGTAVADCGIKAVANAFYLSRFQAVQSGTVVTFRLNASGAGSVKVAIYADNGGMPYVRLAAVNTATPVIAGQNDIIISCPVTAGTYYWIAFNSSANIVCMSAQSCKTYILNSNPFAGFTFPTACTPYLPPASKSLLPDIACLGPLPVPPQSAPNMISPASTVVFKWASVTGATTYWLQANTAADFTGASVIDLEVGNTTSREVTGFVDGTPYYWRLKAGNPNGWGPWSVTRTVTVTAY